MSTNNPTDNKPQNFTVEGDELNKIIDIIQNHVDVSEILFKIRPELKQSYTSRAERYAQVDLSTQAIKIPLDKMNEEERLLHAYLSPPNLSHDLPSLLSYISSVMKKLGDPSDKETIDKILEITISNFYSSKLKLYSEDANDSDGEEEKKRIAQLEEEKKKGPTMTEEQIQKEIADLQKHPLFMTEMPENPEDNPELMALQALKYEGDPDKVALEFYDKSKESLDKYNKQGKQFKDLREATYYICNAIDHVAEDISCDFIKFKLYFHRAQIQRMVKNWGYAIEDLRSAIKYNGSIKEDNKEDLANVNEAFYQLIDTYITVEAFEKATNLINARIKEVSKDADAVKKYKAYENKITSIKKQVIENMEKMEMFKNMESSKKLKLYEELTSRNIRLKKQLHNIPQGYAAEIYKDENNKFHFPILIIYEEFNMTDYIQDFVEDNLIGDILEIIFENGDLPWDREHHYTSSNSMCYYQCSNYNDQTKTETVLYYPCRKDERLIDVLSNKKLHMNGFPIFSIVSPMSGSFYSHFIKTKAVLKRKNN